MSRPQNWIPLETRPVRWTTDPSSRPYVPTFLRAENHHGMKKYIEPEAHPDSPTERLAVLRLLYRSLPPELVERIFGWIAVATYGKSKEGIDVLNVADVTRDATRMLKYVVPDADYGRGHFDKASDADMAFAKTCVDAATNAILGCITIAPTHLADAVHTQQVNYPLRQCASYLRHLEMVVNVLPGLKSTRNTAPFVAQHQLGVLQTWCPHLRSITVAVYIEETGSQVAMGWSNSIRVAIMQKETELLAERMGKLRIGRAVLSLRGRCYDGVGIGVRHGEMVDAAQVEDKSWREVVKMLVEDNRMGDWEVFDRE